MAAAPQLPGGRLFIGVDLGGTTVGAGLLDDDGVVLKRVTEYLGTRKATPEQTVELICEIVNDLQKAAAEQHKSQVLGVGLCCPGLVDSARGVMTQAANFPGWRDVPLAELISRGTRLPVWLENDANAAAAAECWVGVAKGLENPTVAVLTLGTGVGCGLVVGGRVHPSVEAGHAIVIPDGRPCGCGQNGCVEAYCSSTAISKEAARVIRNGLNRRGKSYEPLVELCRQGKDIRRLDFDEDQESILYRMVRQKITSAFEPKQEDGSPISAASRDGTDDPEAAMAVSRNEVPKLSTKEVFEAAVVYDDRMAIALLHDALRPLGMLCVNLCRFVDPDFITITGGVTLSGGYLFEVVREHFRQMDWKFPTKAQIVPSVLGNDAGLIGAAASFRQRLQDPGFKLRSRL